mmetsp:Transcript_16158/g.51817  ORF Transcript_16158/g.51817 Transcript_16158/m.51817 type:complete len:224 (-) Transcript_16158:257-928(-)
MRCTASCSSSSATETRKMPSVRSPSPLPTSAPQSASSAAGTRRGGPPAAPPPRSVESESATSSSGAPKAPASADGPSGAGSALLSSRRQRSAPPNRARVSSSGQRRESVSRGRWMEARRGRSTSDSPTLDGGGGRPPTRVSRRLRCSPPRALAGLECHPAFCEPRELRSMRLGPLVSRRPVREARREKPIVRTIPSSTPSGSSAPSVRTPSCTSRISDSLTRR